ncbi:MAG: ParB N-terminal domain-containing protein [Planctomycetia bacterium]
MKVVTKKITDVLPYGRNPRKNEGAIDAVAASIREFGFQQPIVVDAEGVIIAGHTRYQAAQRLGLERVPVVVAKDLTPAQVQAYRLADNRVGEIAEWDDTLLAGELRELSNGGWHSLEGLGFTADELDSLLSPLAAEVEAADDQADAGEGPEDAEEEPGDAPRPSITTFRDNVVFPSGNVLGIPDLLEGRLWGGEIAGPFVAGEPNAPVRLACWGAVGADAQLSGHVVTFGASVDRVEAAVWGDPVPFLEAMRDARPAAIVMPDLSAGPGAPVAELLWHTYRARWAARYWQEAGHAVIPSIPEPAHDGVFMGLPERLPAAFLRTMTFANDAAEIARALEAWCATIPTDRIFIHGSSRKAFEALSLPEGPEFVWIPSHHAARKSPGEATITRGQPASRAATADPTTLPAKKVRNGK